VVLNEEDDEHGDVNFYVESHKQSLKLHLKHNLLSKETEFVLNF